MPTDNEIFAFFRQRQWLPEMLLAMFREPRDYSVYVKFQTEELMTSELLKCPTTDQFRYANGDSATVTFAPAKGNFKYLRLFGVPIEIEDSYVVNVLSKYGKVHKVVRERYGVDTGYPILNGVRGVYLEVSKALPAQVHIQNFSTRITYEGMERKCYSCGSVDHVKQDCPKRVSVNDRLIGARSFAGVLAGGVNQVKLPTQPSEKVPQVSEFPSVEELRQGFAACVGHRSMQQQQPSSSGSVALPLNQVSSVAEGQQQQPSSSHSELSSENQVSPDMNKEEGEVMEVVHEQDATRKRDHEAGDSDETSEASVPVETFKTVKNKSKLFPFKVNKLLEKQDSSAKLKSNAKKSKK